MYVGGIASYLDTYSSITNCYVKSQSIKSATLDGAYVGGIVGKAQADTAIIGCVVDVDKVEVPHSTSSLYKSYAGFAAGYYGTKADYVSVYGFYQEGCGIYDTYAKEGIVVSADKSFETVSETLNTALYKDKAKFSEKVWDLSGATPTLKKDGKLENVTVTLDIQNEAYQNQTFTVEPGEFNVELATATMYGEYFKKGYSYNDFCYDTEGKESYRWYAPIVNDTTLYAKWVDISGIAGNYEYTLTYGVYTHTGNWIFEDDKFTWVNENSVMKYRYAYDDELELMYIVEYIGIETAPRSAFGGYVGSLFIINDDG